VFAALRYRFTRPDVRAYRDAGPSRRTELLAAIAGFVIDALLLLATFNKLPWDVLWPVLLVIPMLVTTVVAVRDRDAWLARSAIAWLALEQRRRWGPSLPTTPGAAERWLNSAAATEAAPLVRAGVLISAGRLDDAQAELNAIEPTTDLDRLRSLRLHETLETIAHAERDVDVSAIRAAAASVSAEDRRYNLLAAAGSQLWKDITRRRPWRDRFATTAREFAPYAIPVRVRLALAIQQLTMPMAIAAIWLIVWVAVVIKV